MSYACNAAQKGYIKQAIVADVRLDGRQNAQLRKSHISKGILRQAQGSALLTEGAENFTVYSSLKLQVVRKDAASIPEPVIAVESVKQSPRQFTSRDNSEDTQTELLAELLNGNSVSDVEMFAKHLNHRSFSIGTSQQYVLKLYIDAFLMSYPHVSQLDLVFQCIKAAFEDLAIPQFIVTRNQITTEEDLEVTENYIGYLDLNQLPDVFLVGEMDGNLVCDMTQEEFECMNSLFVFSVKNEQILHFRQISGTISPELLLKVNKFAIRVSQTRKTLSKK